MQNDFETVTKYLKIAGLARHYGYVLNVSHSYNCFHLLLDVQDPKQVLFSSESLDDINAYIERMKDEREQEEKSDQYWWTNTQD